MGDQHSPLARGLGMVAGASLIVVGIAVGSTGLGVILGAPMALGGTTMLTRSIV